MQWRGKKSTKFFLNLEKKKQEQCYISKIKDEQRNETSDLVEIIERVYLFYQNLFKSGDSDENLTKDMLSKMMTKLSESDRTLCDQKIRKEEIEMAIKQLATNKSPGSDGLTANF